MYANIYIWVYIKLFMIKSRVIAYHHGGEPVYGLTIPKEFVPFFEGVSFNVTISGNCLIYASGINLIVTQEMIRTYKFEDNRI